MPALTLYRTDGSCSTVPHMLLNYLEIPHTSVKLQSNGGPRSKPHLEAADGSLSAEDYAKINHKGVVPSLVVQSSDGDSSRTVITEIEAVTTYISSLAEDKHVYGRDALEHAKVVEWISWLAGSVQALALTPGLAPYKFTVDEVGFPGVKEMGLRRMKADLARIDEKLRVGDAAGLGQGVDGYFTVADFYLYAIYTWGFWFGFDMAENYPALRDLAKKVEGLEAVKKVSLMENQKLKF